MESIGKPGNFRIKIEVKPVEEGRRVSAFAYIKSRELAAPFTAAC
jgi:gamma-glutamylaminecyclotransferase